jgi:hypothetical protein
VPVCSGNRHYSGCILRRFRCWSCFPELRDLQLELAPATFLSTPFSPLWIFWWGWTRRSGRHYCSAVSACTNHRAGTNRKPHLRSATLGGWWLRSAGLTAKLLDRSEASDRALTRLRGPRCFLDTLRSPLPVQRLTGRSLVSDRFVTKDPRLNIGTGEMSKAES